jgi:hypothetical protein
MATLPLTIRLWPPRNLPISVPAIPRTLVLLCMLLVASDRIFPSLTPQRSRILAIVLLLALHIVDLE